MSRKYLTALAVAACVVLAVGLFVRNRLTVNETPPVAAPPSEASPLQQLSRGAELRRTSAYLAERIAAVAPLVEYRSDVGATGVRWSADTVVSTRPDRLVVAVRAAPADSAQPTPTLATDSTSTGPTSWMVFVGRRADGRVVSAVGLAGGRALTRCGAHQVEEYLVGLTLSDALAGAGVFDLDGRTLGVVVRCGGRLAAIPAGEVARVLADTGSTVGRVRDAYGFTVRALDEGARRYFRSDSGLLVTEVRRGGLAVAAGLRAGDLIIAVDAQTVAVPADLQRLAAGAPADSHTVTRRRGASTAVVQLAPPSAADAVPPTGGADLGLDVTATAPRSAPPRGVRLTAVRSGSRAAAAGLRAGDYLVRVDDAAVTSPAAVQRVLARHADRPTLLVFVHDSVERGVLLPPR
ncbi:MAG: PDZ domain-containing protein [Gemmatimonadaceae bacterium]